MASSYGAQVSFFAGKGLVPEADFFLPSHNLPFIKPPAMT